MLLIKAFIKTGITPAVLFLSLFAGVLGGCSEGDPTALYESLIVEFNDVQSISVTANNTVITTGDTLQLTVTGINSQGGEVNLTEHVSWSLSDDTLARVKSDGLLESISTDGTVIVTASLANFSDTIDITFSSAALTSITIEPATAATLTTSVCRPIALKAIGTYDDATQRDITDKVDWSTTTPSAILTTASTVTLSYFAAPSANVTAALGGLDSSEFDVTVNDDIVSMILSPATTKLATGSTKSFEVIAVYPTDTDVDISATVDWDSSDTSVAAFNNNDQVLTGILQGSTTVTATCGSQIQTAQVSVEGKTIASIEIENANNEAIEVLTIAPNTTYQLSAYIHYSDSTKLEITADATWTATHPAVNNPVVVTVGDSTSDKGLVTSNDIENFDHIKIEYSGFTDLITVQVSP